MQITSTNYPALHAALITDRVLYAGTTYRLAGSEVDLGQVGEEAAIESTLSGRPMTSADYHKIQAARLGRGWIRDLGRAQHDPSASKPWVVLAYARRPGAFPYSIEAGYNRYSGEVIYWSVPSFNDERYDTSQAIQVAPGGW